MKFSVYNLTGEKIKDLVLSQRIFGVKVKPEVVHQVVVAQENNARQVLAHTKTKGEVRGGGKKPWKQKGTGRARHGSIRSPLWVGGGITFGPRKDRNFSEKVNQKQKQLALFMCLTDKASQESLFVFDQFKFEAKTKALNNWLKDIKTKIAALGQAKKILLILADQNQALVRATLNLPKIKVILADSLNCRALLSSDAVLVEEAALSKIDSHYHLLKTKKN